ncbi:MAG: hypothetical protein KDA63_00610 [Planctomycetales bacterium]|nr:hypothetical protein [Planctomycetales bacterium]
MSRRASLICLTLATLFVMNGSMAGVEAHGAEVTAASSTRWSQFGSPSLRTAPSAGRFGGSRASTNSTDAATADVVIADDSVSSGATRLIRSGAASSDVVGGHEPPPNYNFRDPAYYPHAGLGFPIRSDHGTWIGGRQGVRYWTHRRYYETDYQATFQWRW